ncbi:MAG: tRNA preQ1(34) S-adenosylmethionine ribosyltransferase-isomerase QueA [Spirochaetes bacterium]|nr:tRNA preQ1(34) S-adenosylmethionine ribosyltransferase-isomerase QueA [Spirochaetota bacterium]
MKTDFFDFDIPQELIAQKPAAQRSDSRLLVYYRQENKIIDSQVKNITDFLDKDYFLVFNNSKVVPSRMMVKKKETQRPGEFLVLKIRDPFLIEVITDKSKKYKTGTEVVLPDHTVCVVCEELDQFTRLIKVDQPLFTIDYFNQYGLIPLPPYINKIPDQEDRERYQTVYSKLYGSAAAPTAGLHFDEKIFQNLADQQIGHAFISLHVGLGTFQPIYADNIYDHKIHAEDFIISEDNADKINQAIAKGRKIIPVGTTSLRTLETVIQDKKIQPGEGTSELYIHPGYEFKIASGLFTNFHTPKSSLMVLVSTIVGLEKIHEIYQHAINKKYRFFSYGDAMLIL